jgi:IS5 family transposase
LYILQQTLFSFEELMELELKERLPLFFSTLNLWPLVKKMRSELPQGAKGYPKDAVLRALLAAPMVGICTFTGLVERLESDIRFRYQCGFGIGRVPSVATFSRAFQKISKCNIAEELFMALIKKCRDKGIINGEVIAVDSTAIEAYEQKQSRVKSKGTGNADWGSKKDSYGNTITWFGYKLHIAVDAGSELPVAFEVTPANINDGDIGPVLIDKTGLTSPERKKPKFYVMDAGYDQQKNYEAAHSNGAQAIIPLNLRNEKEPPAGMLSNGTPICSMGYEMVYWGADKHSLKFRCAHILGKVDCPFGSSWCSNSNYGLVKKINVTDDLRRYSNPHRNTRKWEELYDQRSSVERVNSRLKTYLTANQLHVWGIQKVKTHLLINMIVLLAGALACKQSVRIAA